MSAFEYVIFIQFIIDYFICFHDILRALSCKHIKDLQHKYDF